MNRLSGVFAALALGATLLFAPPAAEAPDAPAPDSSSSRPADKVHVLGIAAHPTDAADLVAPCGVWHAAHEVTCGVILLTRGEAWKHPAAAETGTDLALRRENEVRAATARSGPFRVFPVDVPHLYADHSAADLSARIWAEHDALARIVHVIRQARPNILVLPAPAPHDNGDRRHSARLFWEAADAASDPERFPEQITGDVTPWTVTTLAMRAEHHGTGGQQSPDCHTGFALSPSAPFTVVGVWTGTASPYVWPEGNAQGVAAGEALTWAQVAAEGAAAFPSMGREKYTGIADPDCARFGIARSFAPFPAPGTPENGHDDALLFGATLADPSGMPLGSTFWASADPVVVSGKAFDVLVSSRSGDGELGAGRVSVSVPTGWTTSGPVDFGPISDAATGETVVTVHPPADARPGVHRLPVDFADGAVSAHNELRVTVKPPVEARLVALDQDAAPPALRALDNDRTPEIVIGAGESRRVSVEVLNRSVISRSGALSLEGPAGFAVTPRQHEYADLAPGSSTTVEFVLTHEDPAAAGGTRASASIMLDDALGEASDLRIVVVPTVVIPGAQAAPVLDGEKDADYGPPLDLARRTSGPACTGGAECGEGSRAHLLWHDNALYLYAEVADDRAGSPLRPEQCLANAVVDSLSIALDPSGVSPDLSTTFRTNIVPFTDDPTSLAGRGPDAACWARSLDASPGLSSGATATGNAPGQEVVVRAQRASDGSYIGGGYRIEAKMPLANLPAAVRASGSVPTGDEDRNTVDPAPLGLDLFVVDADGDSFAAQSRSTWSGFDAASADPRLWGRAYLAGYEPPAGTGTVAPPLPVTEPPSSLASPLSIAESARSGVSLGGLAKSTAVTITDTVLDGFSAHIALSATEAGLLRIYAWQQNATMVPVWETSCDVDPFGFSLCAASDLSAAPWTQDMGGRLVGHTTAVVTPGEQTVSLALEAPAVAALRAHGSLLVSYRAASGAVSAWHIPLADAERP